MSLRVASLNVDSLVSRANANKIFAINALIHTLDLDILMLQDTHLTLGSAGRRELARYPTLDFASHCPNGIRGVMTIIDKKRVKFRRKLDVVDAYGNLLTSVVEFQDKVIYLANVYAPSKYKERIAWLEQMTEVFENNASIPPVDIAGGDWNSVQEPLLDREGGSRDQTRDVKDAHAQQSFLESLEEPTRELRDGWRVLHPKVRDFTHNNRGRLASSRIDRLYVREDWLGRRADCWAIESPGAVHTDHRTVTANLDIGVRSQPRGEGIWKMSPALLDYPVIVKELGEIASETPNGPALEAWLAIKAKLRGLLIERAQSSRRSARRKRSRLLRKRKVVLNWGRSPARISKLEACNLELDALTEWESYQYASAASAKDHALGERPSKYFYARLRANRTRGIMGLRSSEGVVESDPKKMGDIAQKFYSELFCKKPSDPVARKRILDLVTNEISEDSARKLIKPFTEKELTRAIKNSLNGRAGGVDGLTVELYKKLLETGDNGRKFMSTLLAALNDVRIREELPEEFIRCYTCILYKYEGVPGKDPADLKGYRPLSLLNVDYKLYSVMVMHRLVQAIDPVIGEQQYAFLRGRQIADNVKLVQCLIDRYELGDLGSLQLLFLDQEKAYDRVSHDYLWAILEKFGIPMEGLRMFKSLYTGRVTNVYVNGFRSGPVEILSGVGQGDPVSCPLFDISIEGFALLLHASALSGVEVGSKRITSIMFADDTVIPSSMTRVAEDAAITNECLAIYGAASGSKVNYTKTTALIIGDKAPDRCLVDQGVKISRNGAVHLGIPVGVNIQVEIDAFWAGIQLKVAKITTDWLKCHMSSRGRILITKAKQLSLVRYGMQFLPIPDKTLQAMEASVWKLVWNGKERGDINRVGALLPLAEGGRLCQDIRAIRAATALAMVVRMDRHPNLPWVRVAVNLMAAYVHRKGRTKSLVESQYTEPWKQHSARNKERMPKSIQYLWNEWWKFCSYRDHEPLNDNSLTRFRQPMTGVEVLRVKHWYFPNLESDIPPDMCRQGARVWSSKTWQEAGEGVYGETSLIGDLYDPSTGLCGSRDRSPRMARFNAAAENLIESVMPEGWRALLRDMSPEDIENWKRSPREVFQHCVIKGPRVNSWIPLNKATYGGIYKLMIAGKVRDINYDSVLEGPRAALSAMLGRSIRPALLWYEIKQFERNPKADDLLWRFLHARVAVGKEIEWLLPGKKICPYCKTREGGTVDLTILHVWIECAAAREVWKLFASVWERLHGAPPKFLPRCKDSMVALFARCPYRTGAPKSRWITLFTAAVWILWRAYLDSSIDGDHFNPRLVRARYWEEIGKIIKRDKMLAMNPRYNTAKKNTPEMFRKIWGTEAKGVKVKGPPACLVGLRAPERINLS